MSTTISFQVGGKTIRLGQRKIVPFLVLMLADALILLPIPTEARLAGAILLFFVLPGWAFLEAFFHSPTNVIERCSLAIGLSFAFSQLSTLYLIYLPGTISQFELIGAITALTGILLGMAALKETGVPSLRISYGELFLVLGLLGLALLLRLPMLGYSEFHEDEIEVANFAVGVISGEDYSIFLHRKGPAQTLIPVITWLSTNTTTELISRFPFVFAGALSVVAIFLVGKRMANIQVGLIAAGLMVVNGYSVGFARMVQYQTLILLLGPLAIWSFWYARHKKDYRWIVIGSLLLSLCILAHFDALLYIPAVLFIVILIFVESQKRQEFFKWLLAGGLLGIAILAGFYIPFIRDAQFVHTYSYLVDSRIGGDYLYNNLELLQKWDGIYSSRLLLPLLMTGALLAVIKWPKSKTARLGWLVCIGLIVSTYWFADLWKIRESNLAVIPWIFFLVWGWFSLPRNELGIKIAWGWWLTSLIGYVFFVDAPGTHFYIIYPAWVVVAAFGYWRLWRQAHKRWPRSSKAFLPAAGIILVGILFYYQTMLFWRTDSGYRQQLETWDDHILSRLYQTLPEQYSYFGGPRLVGWKVAGAMLSTGVVPDDFRSANEIFSVPVWYTFQTPRSCFTDPQTYFVADPGTGVPETLQYYTHIGNVIVEGTSRIAVYQKGKIEGNIEALPVDYSLEDWEPVFDAHATPDNLVATADPNQIMQRRFGESILFFGFDLSGQTFSPGETVEVNLYWQAIGKIDIPYRAFVHLEGERMWGQHDDDPACRLPANMWRVGQMTRGQFRVTIDPATPPGQYPLTIGLYNPDGWQRLPVFDEADNQLGDYISLAVITVK